ncbi:MAG TPA: long-chain fatty acid--CoA ligase [Bryobacteraceae bacterium]|jgi:fatty-acyl-CoA synthase|nr:long-chain fatty acid--CoA ligase [Bryobacteraceae bacterium]
MQGLMMDYPLTLTHILERSAKLFPKKEIASKMPDGMHRYSYADFHRRVHAVARGLERLGVKPGDRVGTLCWNSFRHLELYFAVPCYGAVLHTLNLRLPSDQLAYIINHADDRVIFVDASLVSILEPIRDQISCTKQFVILPDAENDNTSLAPSTGYEELIESSSAAPYPWPQLDENTAAATCYTSGTTGNPKGVLYTQRALVLHSFALAMADVFAISERDTVLQIVPMFHANGWGIPYAAVMTGARIVHTGRHLQPVDIANLIQTERVTFTAGVPTIWMSLYGYLETQPRDLSSLRTVVVAGSAMPRQFIELYEKKYGVRFRLAWGMTETTPIATFMAVKDKLEDLPEKQRFDLLARHGLPVAGVDIRIVDAEGKEIAWDGTTMGELQTRGPWITSGYYNDPRNDQAFQDGWFRTGDVATIDSEGYLQIMDRTKDLVKSGGEWISSVDLENALMAHPKVMEAAVIAVFHPKWQERPLACIALHENCRGTVTKEEMLDFLSGRVAKWWLPDDIVFVDAVPKTSVGKFNKRALREQFKDYVLPGV